MIIQRRSQHAFVAKAGPVAVRSGFTVMELMVTISIIAVLLALILPAIQKVRDSSRRMTCQNNIRQIGLAIESFESAHRHYPKRCQRRELGRRRVAGLVRDRLGDEGGPTSARMVLMMD